MKVRGFITHKLAEKYADCQDFFSISCENKCLAVSDGMSQSIFPDWWAELLVNAYNDNIEPQDINDVKSLRDKWIDRVLKFVNREKENGKNPWMLENCIAERKGAGATLCGVRFTEGRKYKLYVLGDSCLVCINKDNQIKCIIGSHDGVFNNHPDFFDSMQGGKGVPHEDNLVLSDGEKLFLVTDALAEFLYEKMQNTEDKAKFYVEQLLELESHDAFVKLIDNWRKTLKMHNDDTTLIIVEDDYKNDFIIKWMDNLHCLVEDEIKRSENKESFNDVKCESIKSSDKKSLKNRNRKKRRIPRKRKKSINSKI